MKKLKSLRNRWLVNTVGLICSLGLACVLAVTAGFAVYNYSNMEADMRYRARTTADFFAEYLNLDYKDFYQSCITYAQTFDDKDIIELQFINARGQLLASSYGAWAGFAPATSDVSEAISAGTEKPFVGGNPSTGERIMAVSSPIRYRNGEIIGVLRFVTATRLLDRQIIQVAVMALAALALVTLVALVSSNYYIRTILTPLAEITERAKRIAGGSYGIQIQTRYDDEIGELAEAINNLSAKVNQNEIMQSDFISSLSHELRTPLTAITGWSETLLGEETLDPETRRGMKIILREAKRLTEMVVELLDFTRIQDGRMTLNIEPADIRSEFEDTIFMYGSRLAQSGIQLELTDCDEDIPTIDCDVKRLRQVFLNILDNAAKHGGEGKRILASIAYESGEVTIRIRDFGPGIPEDELPLVKKKFFRGSSKARGTGIGLAVCDEIVQMHGGTLTLENAPGGGTLVTVRLPAVQ